MTAVFVETKTALTPSGAGPMMRQCEMVARVLNGWQTALGSWAGATIAVLRSLCAERKATVAPSRTQLESLSDAGVVRELYRVQDEIERLVSDLSDLQDSFGTVVDVATERFAPAATAEAMSRYIEERQEVGS